MPTRIRMKTVIQHSSTLAACLYLLVGIFGYFTFANQTQQLIAPLQSGVIIMADYNGRWCVIIVAF